MKRFKRTRNLPHDPWIVNGNGEQLYIRNGKGMEVYPKRESDMFARDVFGNFYYAKDLTGNEYYPIRKNKSVLIKDPTIKIACYADGSQRYPTDSRGNEYYLQHEKEGPFLLRKSNGEQYLAKNSKGYEMIPWNQMQYFSPNEPMVYMKDSAGNIIYMKESAFPVALHPVIRCLCHASVLCPQCHGCNTKFY